MDTSRAEMASPANISSGLGASALLSPGVGAVPLTLLRGSLCIISDGIPTFASRSAASVALLATEALEILHRFGLTCSQPWIRRRVGILVYHLHAAAPTAERILSQTRNVCSVDQLRGRSWAQRAASRAALPWIFRSRIHRRCREFRPPLPRRKHFPPREPPEQPS